ADAVRPIHQNLAIEAPGAQQRWIQDLGPIRGGQQDQPLSRIESVELGQQLVERLFLLIVAAAVGESAACPAERIELVDEDDGRRLGARLLEEVTYASGADADEHLDELPAAD